VRIRLLQILEYREALGEDMTVVLDQRGNKSLRIDLQIAAVAVLHFGEAHEARLPGEPLHRECDPHAVGGGRPEEGV